MVINIFFFPSKIALLQNESEVPIEELLASYKKVCRRVLSFVFIKGQIRY